MMYYTDVVKTDKGYKVKLMNGGKQYIDGSDIEVATIIRVTKKDMIEYIKSNPV